MDYFPGINVFCTVVILLGCQNSVFTQSDFYGESGNVFSTIFHKYNANFRPYDASASSVTSVLVDANISVIRFGAYNRERMELESILDLRVKWRDSRLYWYSNTIEYITVNSSDVWTPDIAFLNVLYPAIILINPRFLIVKKTGEIFWYRRFKVVTACGPATSGDAVCPIQIGSYQFSTNEQEFDTVKCESKQIVEATTQFTQYKVLNATSNTTFIEEEEEIFPASNVINNMNITDFITMTEEVPVDDMPHKSNKISQASCILKFQEIMKPKPFVQPIIQTTNAAIRNSYIMYISAMLYFLVSLVM